MCGDTREITALGLGGDSALDEDGLLDSPGPGGSSSEPSYEDGDSIGISLTPAIATISVYGN